jgi:type VI secretion system protein VasD
VVIARPLRLCAPFLALILLVGCSSTATLQVRGVAPLNLNDAGESTPVDVRIYQLKDDAAFKRATFEKLWTEDEKVLGQDRLAAPRVESIVPGNATDQPKRIALGELEVGTRFIGIMALYAKTDARDARVLVLPISEAEKPVIEFSGYGISIAGEAKKPANGDDSSQPAAKGK